MAQGREAMGCSSAIRPCTLAVAPYVQRYGCGGNAGGEAGREAGWQQVERRVAQGREAMGCSSAIRPCALAVCPANRKLVGGRTGKQNQEGK